jgi:hypothetical protein
MNDGRRPNYCPVYRLAKGEDMALDEVFEQAWTRKHDDPAVAVVPSAPRTIYPKSLEELIEICSKRPDTDRIRAAGSHWALSEAAIADHSFVETHDPNNGHQAMGRTLYDVVPKCLFSGFIAELAALEIKPYDDAAASVNEGLYPIHIETGKRVYQLYAELDEGDHHGDSLAVLLHTDFGNSTYLGPWAFQTLGGAGGQTVFGALTTGTHGGDFMVLPNQTDGMDIRMPPIADSVMALHLVADGGMHYWIEPKTYPPIGEPLTDSERLMSLYGDARYGGPDKFKVIHDDDLFNAVLMSAGRFGIVYSIVIAAVRQYSLHQERRLTDWQLIKDKIKRPSSDLYTTTETPGAVPRFLQIGVSLTPHENFTRNRVGITKRWNVPLAAIPGTSTPAGRPERVGRRIADFDQQIQAPRFEFAGNSSTYDPDPAAPGTALSPSFLERACSSGNFMTKVLEMVIKEVENFVASNGVEVGATIAAVAVVGGGGLVALLAGLALLVAPLVALVALLSGLTNPRFGEVINIVKDELLNRTDPAERAAGVFIWQMIALQVFEDQQKESDYEAISYAVMDGQDYLDKNCNINVDSIEVFFRANDDMLIAFVDAQEVGAGRAMMGYASLRFTGQTGALIGQEKFPLTCAVEVAGLRDVSGSKELIDFASMLALSRTFKGILHWGQRNESTRAQIQERFGDTFDNRTGMLHRWRAALSRITENGRLDGFSSEFSRNTGLEIVTPVVGTLTAVGGTLNQPIDIAWDCARNPPGSIVRVDVVNPSQVTTFDALPRTGQLQVTATEAGTYGIILTIAIELGGETREDSTQTEVAVS